MEQRYAPNKNVYLVLYNKKHSAGWPDLLERNKQTYLGGINYEGDLTPTDLEIYQGLFIFWLNNRYAGLVKLAFVTGP